MPELKLLCDDCLVAHGLSAVRMKRREDVHLVNDERQELPLGQVYGCCCGRLYSTVVGYFSIADKKISRVRALPKCSAAACMSDPMYIMGAVVTAGLVSRDRASFACPRCGNKQADNLAPPS